MSGFDVNDLDQPRRRIINWLPNFDAGSVGIILTLCSGIFWFGGELKETRSGLAQVKSDTVAEAARNKEAIAAVAADVKTIQATVNDVRESLAVIRATQQQQRPVKP